MKPRIWELDAFRGVCVLGMVCVHFVYDLTELTGLVSWQPPEWFLLVQSWGGVLFVLLSGVCATLGSRSVRRGTIVLGCAMLVTLVTWGMYRLHLAGAEICIWFGVLHCLGLCMILWGLLKRLPTWALAALGAAMVAAGLLLRTVTVPYRLLVPLGLRFPGFSSADYFPLLPNLGFFLLGAVLGRTAYREKRTLLPGVNAGAPVWRFLRMCGRQSLPIYLLHQPVLVGVCMLLGALR